MDNLNALNRLWLLLSIWIGWLVLLTAFGHYRHFRLPLSAVRNSQGAPAASVWHDIVCTRPQFVMADPCLPLYFFFAAHRFFCASAIRARPSALIVRFFLSFATGRVVFLGRSGNFPFVEATSRARAWWRLAISASMRERMSIVLMRISVNGGLEVSGAVASSTGRREPQAQAV